MPDHLEIVSAYEPVLRRAAEGGDPASASVELWQSTADAIKALVAETAHLREITRPIPADLGDLSDLPPDLIKELAATKTDELEDQIHAIVNAAPDGADLDTILIELFRRFEVKQTRRYIQNKAYRMSKRKLIFSVPGRKGFYASSDDLAASLSKGTKSDAAEERHSSPPNYHEGETPP